MEKDMPGFEALVNSRGPFSRGTKGGGLGSRSSKLRA